MKFSNAAIRQYSDGRHRLLSRERVLIALTACVFFAAWNRADPGLYGLFSLLFAITAIGVTLPPLSLSGLDARFRHQRHAYEGDTAQFEVEIINNSVVPRYLLQVVDPFAPLFGEQLPAAIFIARIPSRSTAQKGKRLVCGRRGLYRLDRLLLRSAFPLGLVTREKVVSATVSTLTVYPRVFPVFRIPLESSSQIFMPGMTTIPQAGASTDFLGIREYRHGDNPRHVHWPTVARHGELFVREFEANVGTELTIVMNLETTSNVGVGRHSSFEYAVSITASVAKFGIDRNWSVQIANGGEYAPFIDASRGGAHFLHILEALARIQTSDRRTYEQAVEESISSISPNATALLFFTAGANEDDAGIDAVYQLIGARVRPICVVFDASSFREEARKRDGEGFTRQLVPQLPLSKALQSLGIAVYEVKRGDLLERHFQ